MVKLSKIQLSALALMARRGGACPGSDEASKKLTWLTANRLVALGLADYSQRAGVCTFRLTSRGREALG
jgi:hypothetical protein